MTDEILTRLSTLDTCVLSDALDAMGVPGVLRDLLPVAAPVGFTGRAITVDLGPAGDPEAAGEVTGRRAAVRHLATAALDAADPADVIVVAHHGETTVGGWGGILSLGAVRAGIAGVVVDGAVRDVDETRALGLPVHAVAITPRSARGTVVERGWGYPVVLRGVTVAPDDLIRADGSGVVVIPAAMAEAVLAKAEQLAARERAMAAAVRAGVAMTEVMGAAYESALDPATGDRDPAPGGPDQAPGRPARQGGMA